MADQDNPLIPFLAAYGPQPDANNLFDEFVVAAAERTGCDPLSIEQPLVEEIEHELRSGKLRSVILTGTAGDGKTYSARRVLERLAPGQAWTNTQKVLEISLGSRCVKFIKDLSELSEKDKDAIHGEIAAALNGLGDTAFVVCVNDGHLLRFLRDRRPSADRQGTQRDLHHDIREMLREEQREDTLGHFLLVNMSRQSGEEIIDRIVEAVVEHGGWSDCTDCPIVDDEERPCPIRLNRAILREKGAGSMRARLQELVAMAAADGRHLSVRHLIMLVVNTLLGDGKSGNGLLTCTKARNRAAEWDYKLTNPFQNVFGENLNTKRQKNFECFRVMEGFGIGRETNNYFDEGLLDDRPGFIGHPNYGAALFDPIRQRYEQNPSEVSAEVRAALVQQRRRLFFTLPSGLERSGREDPWNLSVYKYGAIYSELVAASHRDPSLIPHQVLGPIILGLNRVMTGSMTTTDDCLWLTKPTGVYLGRSLPLLVEEVGQRGRRGAPIFRIESPRAPGLPPALCLLFKQARETSDTLASLLLPPSLVECLVRIANGALPASFAESCLSDVRRFQLAAEAALRETDDDLPPPKLIDTSSSELRAKSIDVMGGAI